MSDYSISPSKLHGEVPVPPSKSQTLRACLFGCLAKGKTTIYNPLNSADTDALLNAFSLLGVHIQKEHDCIQIDGCNAKIDTADDVINVGNSGLSLRLLTAVAALSSSPVVITGDHTVRHQRPLQPLIDGLIQLGAKAYTTKGDGFAPVIIQGPLKREKTTILGEDSQPVTALLIAGAFSQKGITLNVKSPGEIPFVKMTLNWFDRLGLHYQQDTFRKYSVKGEQKIQGFTYPVAGDFSTATFPLIAALITQSEMTIKNLDFNDPQGDKKVIDVLQKMGARIEIDKEKMQLRVFPTKKLKGITVDVNPMIDALPALAVLGCFAEGKTVLKNAKVCRFKECDRIACIAKELKKMGANIQENEASLVITKSTLKGCHLQSYHDHRMAMALSVAAMGAEGVSVIKNATCVKKTYSAFLQDFTHLGANIEVVN